jgi:hypothetical protein
VHLEGTIGKQISLSVVVSHPKMVANGSFGAVLPAKPPHFLEKMVVKW